MTSLFDRFLGSVVAVIVMSSLALSFILESPFEEFGEVKGYKIGLLILFLTPSSIIQALKGNIPRNKERQTEVSEWT